MKKSREYWEVVKTLIRRGIMEGKMIPSSRGLLIISIILFSFIQISFGQVVRCSGFVQAAEELARLGYFFKNQNYFF